MRLTAVEHTASADDLPRLVETYNAATERLRRTHELLTEEVRRLRDQLATANAALVRSQRLAALGEMAAGIAHEIRNPLASIRLYARMLEDDLSDRPAERQVARKIADAVRGLDAVVGDVLNFSRELRPQLAQTAIRETVDGAIGALSPTIDAAGVRVICRVSSRLRWPHDPQMLGQALVNLIRNAVDAMPGGGKLAIWAERDRSGLTIIVRDTGTGIAAEAIDRIFNPFYTTRSSGTGLGLAIVHRIVDAHGGSVSAHNDGGAVFTLTFPASARRTLEGVPRPAQVASATGVGRAGTSEHGRLRPKNGPALTVALNSSGERAA